MADDATDPDRSDGDRPDLATVGAARPASSRSTSSAAATLRAATQAVGRSVRNRFSGSPDAEPGDTEKGALRSKSVWAGVLGALAAILPAFGIDPGPLKEIAADGSVSVLEWGQALAFLVTVLGRSKAKSMIRFSKPLAKERLRGG